jgi:SAM-dependent methyltransferase
MAFATDIVVHSNVPKHLNSCVKVLAGLPTDNPFSLPFAHKRTFAENVDRYDLFLYTEDDIEVTERGIRAFVEVTPMLEPDEIAGHVRYEIGRDGTRYMPDVHGPYHWKPASVRARGRHVFAEFTNEHSGFYILTREQLRRALDTGGYLQEPYEGRYGMLETAATDPFTRCGLRKVTCITAVDDFLVHHLSNRYAGVKGIPMDVFRLQLQVLLDIEAGRRPAFTLCPVEPRVLASRWCKHYDERADDPVLAAVPSDARTVLSVGCGAGATESRLVQQGVAVTALPLDSVVGGVAEQFGIEVVHGSLGESLDGLRGRQFDCVFMSHLLHLLPDPIAVLSACSRLVIPDGTLVIAGYNFDLLTNWTRRLLRRAEYADLGDFARSGLNLCRPGQVSRHLETLGFQTDWVRWYDWSRLHQWPVARRFLQRGVARKWLLRSRSNPSLGSAG